MGRDIAVVCAPPPGINVGMYSVDLGFQHLSKKHGFWDRIQYYRLYPSIQPSPIEDIESSYRIIPSGDEFFQSHRAIIYWGDFLHMRQYQKTVTQKLVDNGLFNDLETAQKRVREVFLLQDKDKRILEKSLSFGSTLLFNTIQDETDPAYRASLERFLKLCGGVWFRDVYSALKACHIREIYQPGCLGVDCANLVDSAMLAGLETETGAKAQVGVFFGRTTKAIESMISFALDLSNRLESKAVWLKWGDTNAFPPLSSIGELDSVRSINSFVEEAIDQPMAALNALTRYKAIITDTYHVCVNAWNLGIPAICLVENEFSKYRNVNFGDPYAARDKRQVFMGMYDALDFFVPGNELNDREQREARILHLISYINSQSVIKSIHNRIRLHAKQAEDSLIRELSRFL